MLENRLNDAKIGYRVSKDTVTMVVHGQFDSQTVINQLMTSFEHFKQVTFEVVRMGL